MKTTSAFAALFVVLSDQAFAQSPVFDLHVHLREGAKSITEYEAAIDPATAELTGFGGMWFGGPQQALQGSPQRIQAQNDASIILATKHPKMLPIATVHPYDGQAALAELKRVAAQGVTTSTSTSRRSRCSRPTARSRESSSGRCAASATNGSWWARTTRSFRSCEPWTRLTSSISPRMRGPAFDT